MRYEVETGPGRADAAPAITCAEDVYALLGAEMAPSAVQVPPLPEERLYPKERVLVDLVAAERLAGRRVLVYATHTGTHDITGRMKEFPGQARLPGAVMQADAVPPERREAWVAKRVEEGSMCSSATPGWCRVGAGTGARGVLSGAAG